MSKELSLAQARAMLLMAAEYYSPSYWGRRNFYVEDRFDSETGENIGPGPILLAPHQMRIVDEALQREGGRFKYSTIIYSAPKKSGKTRIAAMVAAWLAAISPGYAEIYCLANDGKQSTDRVLNAIRKSCEIGRIPWRQTLTRIILPNGAFIEAVPVDPTGEAGAQPTGSFWSEMWGFRLSAKERLWTEFTIPPTRFGQAIRWVESYAGYIGESPVLEQLYHQGVVEGQPHPAFPDLPVYVNERAGIFCYWDTEPRMIWQTPEYYAQEALLLTETEFLRIHRNQWVSSESSAIPADLWQARYDASLGQIQYHEPCVLAFDLGISHDYTALVAVTRHPARLDSYAIRAVRVWKPRGGEKLDYTLTIEAALREWCSNFNVVAIAYDEYQAHKLAVDLRRDGVSWLIPFPQSGGSAHSPGRTIADKMFLDMLQAGKLWHNGDTELTEHALNAAAKATEDQHIRFVKKSDNLRIDALVAASMAVCTIARLNV